MERCRKNSTAQIQAREREQKKRHSVSGQATFDPEKTTERPNSIRNAHCSLVVFVVFYV